MDEKDLLKNLTTKDVLLSLTPIVDAKIVAYFKKEAGWLSPRIEKSMKLAQEMQPKSFDRVDFIKKQIKEWERMCWARIYYKRYVQCMQQQGTKPDRFKWFRNRIDSGQTALNRWQEIEKRGIKVGDRVKYMPPSTGPTAFIETTVISITPKALVFVEGKTGHLPIGQIHRIDAPTVNEAAEATEPTSLEDLVGELDD